MCWASPIVWIISLVLKSGPTVKGENRRRNSLSCLRGPHPAYTWCGSATPVAPPLPSPLLRAPGAGRPALPLDVEPRKKPAAHRLRIPIPVQEPEAPEQGSQIRQNHTSWFVLRPNLFPGQGGGATWFLHPSPRWYKLVLWRSIFL